MAKNNIASSLAYFAQSSSDDSFTVPSDDIDIISGSEMEDYIESAKQVPNTTRDVKKSKKSKFEKHLSKVNETIERYSSDIIDDFDDYIGECLLDDEDIAMKNSLISGGRKYARDTQITGEQSEINKSFAPLEQKLLDLLADVKKDSETISKELDQMRTVPVRVRNQKNYNEMFQTKATIQNNALSTIKELHSIKKSIFDLQLKTKKDSNAEGGNNDLITSNMMQKVFSLNRQEIAQAYGGYASATTKDDYTSLEGGADDDYIQQKYFNSEEYTVDDEARIRQKYENQGVHYVLLYNKETGSKHVLAEDKDGNIIPDYPQPATDMDNLEFEISESTKSAQDTYFNQYELRIVED